MRRRRAIGFSVSTFLPSITISPDVGSIRRLTMRKSVVLPEPEVPTSIQVLPSGTSNVTASTADLLAPAYCLVISWNAIFAILVLLYRMLSHFLPIICNISGDCKTDPMHFSYCPLQSLPHALEYVIVIPIGSS